MAQRTFATPTDYARLAEDAFDGDDAKLQKRLRSASIEVESLTRLAGYVTDDDGYATDADLSDAFTEATCAIVEYWEETGAPTGAGAHEGAIKIGSVSLGTTSSRESDGDAQERRFGAKAINILRNAGLLTPLVSY
ncbi:hypothetical protein [Mycetocola miduiensis]|uniref:Head-to-tail adaptor n=1 Tax=Mycetocola miduiensis TaxID=995034 RepID=A0A1I5AUW2_9MICO|nr:hypothetical protein [Mycetocola miduiensis]SFN66215.1 hypothetical protein SAMN05216219_1554 [Mycetocola miduiensis]